MSKVNHPKHYNTGKIETIDLIHDMGISESFCIGNAIKYIMRYKHKGTPVEDLQKAKWYLDYAIKTISEEKNERKTDMG